MVIDSTRIPAVIMGLGHPRQTAYVRSLARIGVPVHALHTERGVCAHSRHLTRFHQLDDDPESQLAYLENLGRELGYAFLVPTNDDYVALVSRHRAQLSRHFLVPLPGWEIIGSIFDRAACYAKAASVGIKVPRYWSPRSDFELSEIVSELDPRISDYIIKTPSILSAPANPTAIRLTKSAPKNRSEIIASCMDLKQRTGEYPMIQEVIPGAADCAIGVTMVISPKGEVVLAYCVRRLRLASYKIDAGYVHPYELGSVVWCETIHDEEAVEAAREVARAFSYTGQITVEFRRDSRDQALYLMKVEPRTVRATSLSAAIGMDIPAALYRVFQGETVNVAKEYPNGVGWLWLWAYGQSLLYNPHHNRRDVLRVLLGIHRIKAFGEDLSDPALLVRSAAGRIARLISRLRRGRVKALPLDAQARG
jgi:predicted ATP-grasp superfamily ATP-dependent carboligase